MFALQFRASLHTLRSSCQASFLFQRVERFGLTRADIDNSLFAVGDRGYTFVVLNYIWLALVLLAVAIGGWNDRLKDVTEGAFDGAKTAVTIALALIGIMALWLGVMRLAERAGLVQRIARGLRPIMRRLFPDVPPAHPAIGSMVMNMSPHLLGLGNTSTPLVLRAIPDLQTLNPP